MAHGLLWLPLLGVFIWLAWAGWNEYQKLETYKLWAAQFDRAKYDIYAVLGQLGSELTWGVPTRQGPICLETFSLQSVQTIRLLVNNQPADLQTPPTKGRAVLEFGRSPADPVLVPFTEPALAAKWGQHLLKELNSKGVGSRE